ncbi:MAG: 3-isopropylmalate dehydratase small subunit [Gammaproteobacteria bacterium]|nr:3-isopropylmalate dehydratase small subunit [Gammaproteobacteria bacterium]
MMALQSAAGGSGPVFVRHSGIPAPFLRSNVDTDIIAPINPNSISGLSDGERAFEPLRYFADGSENPDFVLNREPYRSASILLAGENFGTGSSRASGVRLPMAFGIRVVIAPSFGPIFYTNSIRLGLLAITLGEAVVTSLAEWAVANPGVEMMVDLERNVIEAPGLAPVAFGIDPRVRTKFLRGLNDLDEMLLHSDGASGLRNENRSRWPWIDLGSPGAGR